MMQQENQSLFGLNVDQVVKNHLYETAKWGRFLAITGFVVCVIIVLAGIITAVNYDAETSEAYRRYNSSSSSITAAGVGGMIFYILVGILYFFPSLFLLRFSNQMKTALVADDQATLTSSFQNLKVLFRFMGVMMIIFLAFFVLGLLGQLMSA